MALNSRATTDAVEILHRKFYEGKPEKLQSLAECRANDEIARKIQALRTKAGLTQAQLARKAKVSQQQIAKLEHPDSNPTIETLERVARALGARLNVAIEEAA